MNRYIIERKKIFSQVYSIVLCARSEEEARLKANEYVGAIVESDLVSEELRIIDTEPLDLSEKEA